MPWNFKAEGICLIAYEVSSVRPRRETGIEESYGADNLDLVVASGYVGRLLGNVRIVRYLAQNYPELLSEFQKIAEPRGIAA